MTSLPQIELLTARQGHLPQGYLKGRPMMPSTFVYWAFEEEEEEEHLLHEPETWGQSA